MARVATDHQDDPTQLGQQDPAAAVGTANSANVPPPVVDASAASPNQAAPKAPSGRFQDISRMLYANQGQGKAVADQAIQAVGAKAGTAQSQLDAAKSAYGAQANAAVQPFVVQAQQAPVPQVTGGTLRAGGGGLVGRPTTQLNTTPDIGPGRATQMANATYTGPTSLTNTTGVDQAGLQQSFTDAQRAASLLSQPAGISTLLGRSGGAGAFDDLLAQQQAGGDLAAARGRFAGLQDKLNSAIADTSPTAAAQAATAQANQQGRDYLGGVDADTANRTTAATNIQNNADAMGAAIDQYHAATHDGQMGGPSFQDFLAMSPDERTYWATNTFSGFTKPYQGK